MWDFGEHRAATAAAWVSATLDRITFGEITLEDLEDMEKLAIICAEYIQTYTEVKNLTEHVVCDILNK